MITTLKNPLVAALALAASLFTAESVAAEYNKRQAEPRSYDDRQDVPRMSTRDQRSFERYLKSNSQTAQQLYQEPELIRDEEFLRDNQSLDEWLDSHATAANALEDNPHRYLKIGGANQPSADRTAANMSEHDLRDFESLLANNPETARRLYENPELLKDRQFARNNTALNDWINNNPKAANAVQANPHKYLWREPKVERKASKVELLEKLLK